MIEETNDSSKDENENLEVEDWKTDSETKEVGARELDIHDADMINKDSMFMCFYSCLSELQKFLKEPNVTIS